MSAELSLVALRARALLNHNLREFFVQRQILEVETPVLSSSNPTMVPVALQQAMFLQPIYSRAMQDLIRADSGAIYQLGKAFRADTIDRRHQYEFSLLQWCEPIWSLDQIQQDLTSLFGAIFAGDVLPEVRSYAQAFQLRLGFDPTTLSAADLRIQARRLGLTMTLGDDRQAWLDLIFSHFIEPTLGIEAPLYLTELSLSVPEAEPSIYGQPLIDVYMEGIKVGSVLCHSHTDMGVTYSIALGIDRLLMVMMESRRITQVYSWFER